MERRGAAGKNNKAVKPVTAVQDCVPPFVGVKPLDSFVAVLEFLTSIHHKYGKKTNIYVYFW